jgi:hypothetical protein
VASQLVGRLEGGVTYAGVAPAERDMILTMNPYALILSCLHIWYLNSRPLIAIVRYRPGLQI